MTTQDMVGIADILDCFRYFSGVGLKSIPHAEDADTWLRVLSDVPAVLLHLAADEWIRRPVKDKGGVLRGQRWSPTAGELRSVAFGLEATQRVETTQRKRGCASCGEVIDEHGGIAEPGTGHRTISQHCYPAAATGGGTDWSATPYRIASRQVLCDCELGKWMTHVHTTADRDKLPKGWQPTITAERALHLFRRDDAALYLSGTDNPSYRLRPEDARPSSPFYCRASPEELHGNAEHGQALRRAAYDFLRGNRPAPALDKVGR